VAGIRTLTFEDIQQAKELSDAEGWNQSLNDWKLLVTSPGNVSVGYTSGDKIIATATAMNYNDELVWIGMVLVHREHRGKGLSKLLLNELLFKLKHIRLVKLDATPAGWPVYSGLGFKNESIIYRMISKEATPKLLQHTGDINVNAVSHSTIAEVTGYDKSITGVSRKILIDYLVKEFPSKAFILKRKGVVKGFILGREGAQFSQIGPLMAESTGDAEELLSKAISYTSGKSIVADIPEDKIDLIDWMLVSGFQIQRQFTRMYLGEEHKQEIPAKQYLICGPEFG
jgi:GNAT superfamily N-acetyltransferase